MKVYEELSLRDFKTWCGATTTKNIIINAGKEEEFEGGYKMKVYEYLNLRDFQAWSGAVETKNKIIQAGKEQEFEEFIEECYPEGLSATKLNDILAFDAEYILDTLGIEEMEEE